MDRLRAFYCEHAGTGTQASRSRNGDADRWRAYGLEQPKHWQLHCTFVEYRRRGAAIHPATAHSLLAGFSQANDDFVQASSRAGESAPDDHDGGVHAIPGEGKVITNDSE